MTTFPATSVAVDFLTKRITVSRAFLNASRKVGAPEFLFLKKLTEEMPAFSIELRVTCTSHKIFQPTYTWMLDYIKVQPDAEERTKEFQEIRSLYRNYNYVRAWFMNKYPNANEHETLEEKN